MSTAPENVGLAPLFRLGFVTDKFCYQSGNLYGTTQGGGVVNAACLSGCGTVFKLDPSGTETVLYSFQGSSDGAHPAAGLLLDRAGNLYGTNAGNGFSQAPLGTLFKIAQSAAQKGKQKATNRMLNAFIHQVGMHSRKPLTSAQAATLVQDAKDLMT
ncbi:MAG: hypothetical protein JO166_16520 [Deltaproteobacteria bacterium]|nr:hypothetical protein [Deltaproteobacteria bacterium]